MIKVVVAGNFFPLHDGHINHFKEARKLGDWLIIIIGSDDYLRMRGKQLYLSEINRQIQLKNWADEVIVAEETDGTIAKTLYWVKPKIYAKGEDTVTIPENELAVCKEINCKVVYGVGKELYHSSDFKEEI